MPQEGCDFEKRPLRPFRSATMLVITTVLHNFCTPISDQPTDQQSSQQPRGLLKNNQDLTIFSPKAGPMKDPRHVAPGTGAL